MMRSRTLLWLVVATSVLLLIPLIAMQFTEEVNWSVADFAVMGLMLLVSGSLFVLVTSGTSRKRQLIVGSAIAMAFLYVWAELAVGIFTNVGS